MNCGCMRLIAMGAQSCIPLHVIGGAMAIPNDLKEAAKNYGLLGWPVWKTLILPAIFPFWITGACTAAGGAWNATLLAEVAIWGGKTLEATGLGAFINEVSFQEGGTGTLALLVVAAIMALVVVVVTSSVCCC